jgi:HD-GYP domain-containing protein (c-di-GMP phosphodiesterase class II)
MPVVIPLVSAVVAAAVCALAIRERRLRRGIERLAAATLETLLNAIDANDPVTGAHVRRVAQYALVLANAARLDESECREVERVALFHDIGKIYEALFDILHDADKLTPEERKAVRTHPERGCEVLEPLDAFYPELCDGVISHHERWDGTGYPRGLRGVAIPITARIVSIADAFDAITASRRHHDPASIDEAIEKIRAGRGTQFDPNLADLFLAPPILAKIRKARQRIEAQPRARGGGRRRQETAAAPDITFRWRTVPHAQRLPDPAHRKSS